MRLHTRSFAVALMSAAGVCALTLAPLSATAAQQGLEELPPAAATPKELWSTVAPSLTSAEGRVDVFVQTEGTGALQVQRQADGTGRSTAQATQSADRQVEQTEATVDDVTQAAEAIDHNTQVLYSTAYSVPGVALSADVNMLKELAERDDIVKISRIVPRTLDLPDSVADPTNANSDAFTRAVDAWTQTGSTGKGVNVAVIDTGLDYTHSDFGGPGTPESYTSALASTDAPDPSWYDGAKYLGGWDFAGSTYNATSGVNAYQPVPHPDANPIDGRGGNHGTHVAGTAAGYGVGPSGTTYRGDYASIASESIATDFKVGPGSAPQAGLYALKVFGDAGGSTALTGAAIEWIAKAVATGTKIDVVNMSLGTSGGAIDDPDNTKLDALMDAGVLPVVAAGNSGDVTDVAGSPGTTERALTVAASASGRGFADAVLGYAGDPATTTAQTVSAQYSQNYANTIDVTAPVTTLTDPNNLTGCAKFTPEDEAKVAGKMVWLAWDDTNIACGSATRFDNAQAAGAVGVLLESQHSSFENGIAGNTGIPGAQLTSDAVTALRPALERGTLTVTLKTSLKQTIPFSDATRVDTLASFSSRGTHGSIDNVLKPDVAAPGVGVVSAGNATGNGAASLSGTSMASPHTAGIAALVKQRHPEFSADRVKQQIMNTAVHTLTTGGASPIAYGPARSGGGRVDAFAAVTNEVFVSSVENGHLVSASFGVVEVGAEPVTQTRTIRVENTSDTEHTYSVSYSPRTETPGVAYSLDASTITVAPGDAKELTLTLSIKDPAALRRTLDPTSEAQQGGLARQYVTDASGVVDLVAENSPALRLAVYAAPKPVSETTVQGVTYDGTDGTMTLTGRGLDQGEGTQRYRSVMVPLQMGVTDPNDTYPADSAHRTLESADILAVGASSTAPQMQDPSQGVLTVGVAVDGNWSSLLGLTYPLVNFDVNGDKRVDFTTLVRSAREEVDAPMAITIDVVTGMVVDQRPVNNLYADQGSNVFDNNVLAIPVSLAALGYTPDTRSTSVAYTVETRSYYAPAVSTDPNATLVDDTSTARIDVYHPDVWFGTANGSGTAGFADHEGSLSVHRKAGTTTDVLVLHLFAGNGQRYQIVPVTDITAPPTNPGNEPSPGVPTTAPGDIPGPGGTTHGIGSKLATTGMDFPVLSAVGSALALLLIGGALGVHRHRRAQGRS